MIKAYIKGLVAKIVKKTDAYKEMRNELINTYQMLGSANVHINKNHAQMAKLRIDKHELKQALTNFQKEVANEGKKRSEFMRKEAVNQALREVKAESKARRKIARLESELNETNEKYLLLFNRYNDILERS